VSIGERKGKERVNGGKKQEIKEGTLPPEKRVKKGRKKMADVEGKPERRM